MSVAVRSRWAGNHQGVEHGEHPRGANKAEALLDPRTTVDPLEDDPPLRAVRV
jgi:hypothetical protein